MLDDIGLYSYSDLESLGLIRNRADLSRKQRKYAFPKSVKLGSRQAGFLRAEVHQWVQGRVAASRATEQAK
jgi:predicted DNA-binding transcriptional regulator AlpA